MAPASRAWLCKLVISGVAFPWSKDVKTANDGLAICPRSSRPNGSLSTTAGAGGACFAACEHRYFECACDDLVSPGRSARALTSALLDRIVKIVADELVRLTESLSFETRFKNALSAIAGLFRYREVKPFALVAGRDPAAQRLRDDLNEVEALLARHRRKVPRCDEKRTLIYSVRDYLDGGGDPKILIQIEDLDDERTACLTRPGKSTTFVTISHCVSTYTTCCHSTLFGEPQDNKV